MTARVNVLLIILMYGLMYQVSAYSAQPDDKNLGRLFTSSSERYALDRQRREDLFQGDNLQNQEEIAEEAKTGSSVVMNGVLKSSKGEKVVWINGKKVNGTKGPGDVRVYRGPDSNNRIVVGVPGKRAVKLGPGQQLRLPDGKVAENHLAN